MRLAQVAQAKRNKLTGTTSGGVIFGLFILILPFLLLGWVYNDAEEKGFGGLLWVLLILIFSWPALVIHLVFFHGLSASMHAPAPKRSEDLQYRSM